VRRPGLVAMQQWRDLPLVLARCLIVLHSGSFVRSLVRSLRSNQLDTTQDGTTTTTTTAPVVRGREA